MRYKDADEVITRVPSEPRLGEIRELIAIVVQPGTCSLVLNGVP